jgi:hypothetical protein
VPDNTKLLQHTLDCVAQWRDAGGTCVTVNSMGRGMTEADEHIDWFAQIKAKV